MSSPSSPADYTFQRPSATATRAMVTGNKPPTQPSASSADVDAHVRPTLERRTTDNYERAAAEAMKAGSVGPVASAGNNSSSAATGDVARHGMPRQQSWQMRDFKGEKQGSLLGDLATGHGYSSTGK